MKVVPIYLILIYFAFTFFSLNRCTLFSSIVLIGDECLLSAMSNTRFGAGRSSRWESCGKGLSQCETNKFSYRNSIEQVLAAVFSYKNFAKFHAQMIMNEFLTVDGLWSLSSGAMESSFTNFMNSFSVLIASSIISILFRLLIKYSHVLSNFRYKFTP